MTPALPGALNALKNTAAQWLAEVRPAMVVQLLHTRGSVPREAGTRMLVTADACAGTIGGGHLEWQAVALARQALAQGQQAVADQHVVLGPSLGQCCGGALTWRAQRLAPAALADWPDEVPLFTLQLHGAGHVAQALVRLLANLPCQVHWVDEREDAFDGLPPGPPQVHTVVANPAEDEVADMPPDSAYLVMTHSHALDLRLVQAVLARGDFGFLGLIGSGTKRRRFAQQLAARGHAPQALQRLHCPIGLPGIRGKAPEVLAVSVCAQLLQWASTRAAAKPDRG